jgi:hypothetical protein
MDRRDFFKTLLATAIAAPALAKAKPAKSTCALYLISDTPEDVLLSILPQIGSVIDQAGRRFTFLTPHPIAERIEKTLSAVGWDLDPRASGAGLAFSFQPLGRPSLPSFTLINNGRVCDIRSPNLWQAWKNMSASAALSSSLTTASIELPRRNQAPGKAVAVYADGKKQASLPLHRDQVKAFDTMTGRVVVGIEAGRARVLSSTCRHQVCLASPPVSLAGERIVCAPRHFLLEVEGPRLVDTVTG